jgi:hypothetical protein
LGIAEIDAINDDLTVLKRLEAIDDFDEGGFARTRWAANHHHFTWGDVGGTVVQHLDCAVPL